jgi:glycosyltransferase involved in cell wall biosynthesis
VRLSICIATYNRAPVIGETIAGILPQLCEGVELLVVDGASTDATATAVGSLIAGRGDCRYVRLAHKGGVDRDYCIAVEQARGDYCWLMTDDDLLKPGAIVRVLQALGDDPDLLVINAEVAGPDLATTLLPRKLRLGADRQLGPAQQPELLALAGDLLSFIGSVVIRRALWMSRDAAPYIGTEFVHVGMIFQAPLERAARILAEPLVRIRYGRANWSARAFEVWMFTWPALIWGLPGFGDDAREAVTPREPWKRMPRLANMRAQGCYGLAEYRRRLKPLRMSPLTRLGAAVVAAVPDVVFRGVMTALLLFRPHERAMMLFELDRGRAAGR